MGSFNIIVGMDWLTLNHAEVVCFKKVLRIPIKNGRILNVFSKTSTSKLNLMSCFQAQRYLCKKYVAFIALVMEKEHKEKKIYDIPVVRGFPDVFPGDISGLPLNLQVEFRIDLVHGANPIAKALYRLTSSEMQELLSQLQELSNKGFLAQVRPPRGTPVLFVNKKYGSLHMWKSFDLFPPVLTVHMLAGHAKVSAIRYN
ncbi:uncharacterized protein LOC143563910 [Bidens hawaiensis]|uniref:uncharacterized protein LOC143563910 n=1 Tax=Bidens hawaiensis TaxID=980011 RepID=UPI0040498091